MTINERIKIVIDYYNDSKTEISNVIELNPRTFRNIYNGINIPNAETVGKLISYYKNINARWLMTGEGEMLQNEIELPPENKYIDQPDKMIIYLEKQLKEKEFKIDELNKKIGRLERDNETLINKPNKPSLRNTDNAKLQLANTTKQSDKEYLDSLEEYLDKKVDFSEYME